MPEYKFRFDDGEEGTFYDADEDGALLFSQRQCPNSSKVDDFIGELNRRISKLGEVAMVRPAMIDEIEEKLKKLVGCEVEVMIRGEFSLARVVEVFPYSAAVRVSVGDILVDLMIESLFEEPQLPS